jgi:hypothetical protein
VSRTCQNDEYLPTLTSSCNVPGPIISLQNDPSVPLYLYNSNTDAAYNTFQQPINLLKWKIFDFSENSIFESSLEKLELTLYIQNGIDKPFYDFTINTPISIYVHGDISLNYNFSFNQINKITDSSNIVVSLNNIVFNVYYNTSVVYSKEIILINTTDLSNSLIFDLSGSSNNINNNTFFGSLFIGNLNIPNILLNTTKDIIYDFKITANFNSFTKPIYINDINFGIITNTTNNYISNNCNIKNSVSIIQKPFSLIGL